MVRRLNEMHSYVSSVVYLVDCVCVCVCVHAFEVSHVWIIHTVTGGVTCCGLDAPTTGAGATPLRNICHNHHHIMFTVALNECIVLPTLPNKTHAHNDFFFDIQSIHRPVLEAGVSN